MSTTYCGACLSIAVKKSGDICSVCRAKGHQALRDQRPPDEPLMDEVDPLLLLERAIRLLEVQQNRLIHAVKGDGLVEQPYRADYARESRVLGRDLAAVSKEWRLMKAHVKASMEALSLEEMQETLLGWYANRLTGPQQRELLQKMTRLHNAGAQPTEGKVG